MNIRLKEIASILGNLTQYAVLQLNRIKETLSLEIIKRRTTITGINSIHAKVIAKRDTLLRYDEKNGYLRTQIYLGKDLFKISCFDRILYIRKSRIYTISEAP